MALIVGVDIGKNGALVFLNGRGEVVKKCIMPLIGKTYYDWFKITEIIQGEDVTHVFIEDVHAIFNSAAGATFMFGGGFHGLIAIVSVLQIPYTLVQPKTWQKVIYQGVHEIRKPPKKLTKKELASKAAGEKVRTPKKIGSLNTKAMSEVAAKRLFPDIDLRANEGCSVSHDGIVDALLLAEYGRRTFASKGITV